MTAASHAEYDADLDPNWKIGRMTLAEIDEELAFQRGAKAGIPDFGARIDALEDERARLLGLSTSAPVGSPAA